jgi:hypothetical protein
MRNIFFSTPAVEINKGSNLPWSFAAQLRCSLVADRRICASFTPRWAAKSRRHLATFI